MSTDWCQTAVACATSSSSDATVEGRGPTWSTWRNIANFGWNIEGSVITPAVSTAPVAPQTLLDVVSCSCTAECKACSAHAAAATAQAFHARTTANTWEETSAVVLSSASRWISKTMKGRRWCRWWINILFISLLYTVYILAYRNGWQINSNSHMFYFLNIYMHSEKC